MSVSLWLLQSIPLHSEVRIIKKSSFTNIQYAVLPEGVFSGEGKYWSTPVCKGLKNTDGGCWLLLLGAKYEGMKEQLSKKVIIII